MPQNLLLSQIVSTASTTFNRYGIKSVSMDYIASQLGISKKTLYEHVSSKEDLIKQILTAKLQQLHSITEQASRSFPDAIADAVQVFKQVSMALKDVNPAMLFDLQKYYPAVFKLYVSFRDEQVTGHLLKNIERGIAQGLYRDDMNVMLIGKVYLHMLEFITDPDLEHVEHSFEERYKQAFLYHMRGICTQKGLQLLNHHQFNIPSEL